MSEETGRPAKRRRGSSGYDGGKNDGGQNDGGQNDGGETYGGQDGHEEEAVTAHASFVERLYGGGEPATPDLLDRANEIWRRLPGSVTQGAPQLRPNRPGPDRRTAQERARSHGIEQS